MSDFKSPLFQREILATVIKLGLVTGLSYMTITWLLKKIDPTNNKQKQSAKEKAELQLKRVGKSDLKLTEHEMLIASHLVHPEDISVSWDDVAGLDEVLNEIFETVIFPIKQRKHLTNSRLTSPPKGILLHGPPGCGKTLIAKATAKAAVTTFISLDISMLTDKWYGESQKLVAALFSLAEKLQPCIIFIDEIDSLLRNRSSQDHEATAMMKAQFMFLWDGLSTDREKVVIVMGATNRPSDLDVAILRRMPATFRIPLPDPKQRSSILKLILEKETTEAMNFDDLAQKTEGLSGSDLQELCRTGSLYRVQECARRVKSGDALAEEDLNSFHLRPITMDDLTKALKKMMSSKLDSNMMLVRA